MSTALQSPRPDQSSPSDSKSAPRCEKCNSLIGDFAVCPTCGYYAKLGHFVDIDEDMELGFEGESKPFRFPKWAYITIAGSVAILAEAISLAVLLPVNTIDRLVCDILHLSVGILLIVIAQTRATFLTLMDDIDATLVDCLCFPPRAWEAILKRLPESASFFHMMSVGFLSILMSLLVIRAIPWVAIFTDEPAPPIEYENTLLKAVLSQAPSAEESDLSMEEALSAFADQGEQDFDAEEMAEEIKKELTGAETSEIIHTARCIVIGFYPTTSEKPSLRSIVVATADRNPLSTSKWKILGTLPITDEAQAQKLYGKMRKYVTPKPFTPSNMRATWVKPSIRCEVNYQERGEERTPVNLELQRLF